MKYILETRNIESGEIESIKEYKSLLKLSHELNTTYCSVYNNAIFNEITNPVQPKKKSQLMFNKKYKIRTIY